MELIFTGIVAIALAVLLLWRNPLIPAGAYKIGFFVGLATLGLKFLGSGTSLTLYSRNTFSFTATRILMLLILVSPFLVLIETGLAGYRGFSSWFRYFCLILSVAGAFGLMATFIVPRFVRR